MRGGRGQPEFRGLINARNETAEHESRIENLMLIGHISEVDYKAGKARVSIDVSPGVTTDWLPWSVPRASRNCYWIAPEVGEQVRVEAWSGNIADGVILQGINEEKWPHIAQSPDVERIIYDVPEKGVEDIFKHSFHDFRRDLPHYWRFLKKDGRFRWQVLENEDGSGIVMDENHIQLRVKDTQLVIKDGKVSIHIKGKTTEFWMTEDRIFSQVQDKSFMEMRPASIEASVEAKGFWKLTANAFVADIQQKGQLLLNQAKAELALGTTSFVRVTESLVDAAVGAASRIALSTSHLTAFFQTSWMKLSASLAELRVAGSRVTAAPSGVTIEAPMFNGVQGAAQPAQFEAGAAPVMATTAVPEDEEPHVTIEPPDIELGVPPYYPDKEE